MNEAIKLFLKCKGGGKHGRGVGVADYNTKTKLRILYFTIILTNEWLYRLHQSKDTEIPRAHHACSFSEIGVI